MLLLAWLVAGTTGVAATAESEILPPYLIQPGDILQVSVWQEQDLRGEILVRPDGGISFPLVGDLPASGLSITELIAAFKAKLARLIPDPEVTIAIKQIGGNRIYVIGKVQRPGEFSFSRPIDVMQALSLAGGATPFAALNEIRILRRESGQLRSLSFRYGDVANGKELAQNILLASGDTVIVP